MYQIIKRYTVTNHDISWEILLFCIAISIGLASGATALAESTAPLIQISNLEYLGQFALPNDIEGFGSSNFRYGSHGVTPYNDPSNGKKTLFLEGHPHNQYQIAQVEVPSTFVKSSNYESLPKAKVLQNFYSIVDGKISTTGITTPSGGHVYGMLPYNGRLIVGITEYYGSTQDNSHAVSSFDLSVGNDLSDFYDISGSAPPRALGGHMTTIPSEWRASFGGPALTGSWGVAMISSTSAGPTATVFDPDDLDVKNPIPGTTVLYYPIEHPLRATASQNNYFNQTSRPAGIAFPTGSRSVLFFGRHGTGPYCYGTSLDCEPQYSCEPSNKGPHAPPYRHQVWAYDANDLINVKNGSLETWEPQPYAIWALDDITEGSCNNAWGGGYDPETGRMFIAVDGYSKPRIAVYKINVPGSSSQPLPPTNLHTINTP